MRDLTAEEVVTELHPYNEWSDTHTRAAVAELSELVRYLNHATQHPEALTRADVAGEVLQLLGQTVRRLPQVLRQASARTRALTGSELAEAELGERLDALGQEIEGLGFAARRLDSRSDPGTASEW
jgi:hypothetical protein